jgi:exodeoxyribonuclease VII large subunit
MSEQLSLMGIVPPKTEPDEKKTRSKSAQAKSVQAKPDPLQARINALVEGKPKAEVIIKKEIEVTVTTAAVVAEPVTPVAVPIESVEPEVLSVSDLNRSIKGLLEKNFSLLWVQGEISNFKMPTSGHLYFTLKDSKSQIRSVMFKGHAQALKFKPEDGMEVLVRCRVTTYEPRGDYQLFCEVMEPVGYGALQVAFEKLKAKLQGEGLFDPAKKKKIPAFPTRIGIITSPTGAAIRDMLNILSRRFGGGLDITILPSNVQGEKAPGELVRAIELANRMGPSRFDVLIVGRGGGSLEDLWAFNIEEVARAVANSRIPTISAVGHEVDFTICDFVADLRAPTPSAAAELVVKNKADLADRVRLLTRQFIQLTRKRLQLARAKFEGASKRLIDPKRRLQDLALRCDEWTDRLVQAVQRFVQDSRMGVKLLQQKLGTPEKRIQLARQTISGLDTRLSTAAQQMLQTRQSRFAGTVALLNGLSPLAVLERGYSIVKKDAEIIKNSNQVKAGDIIQIRLSEGELSSQIL